MLSEYYEKYYKNGALIDCYPVDFKQIGFIHKDAPQDEEDDRDADELPTRLIAYLPERYQPGLFGTVIWHKGIRDLYLLANKFDWIVETSDFMINEVSRRTQWYPIPDNNTGQLAKGITNINGTVYAYGMIRSVFKYLGIKQWENITNPEKHPVLGEDIINSKVRFIGDQVGFSALGGFDENDLYAGGNHGDCWHYNGKTWKKVDLPTNADISAITCASNGQVYISSRLGPILVGRNDTWKIINEFSQITHSAWFKGRIYFASHDGRIYTHNESDNKLVEATFKTKYPDHMHHIISGIASCDECLVAYTEVQAYAYDGEIWHEIIELPALSKNK